MKFQPIWIFVICTGYVAVSATESNHVAVSKRSSPPPPGPNANTMGKVSAQAMDIGTGGSQQDKYSSSYQTPNYTQYTNNNFKEFMPDYKSMMNFDSGSNRTNETGLGIGGMASFSSFMDIGSMLKSFMELQKQQAEADKQKLSENKTASDSGGFDATSPNSYKESRQVDKSDEILRNITARSWPWRHGNVSLYNLPVFKDSAQSMLPGMQDLASLTPGGSVETESPRRPSLLPGMAEVNLANSFHLPALAEGSASLPASFSLPGPSLGSAFNPGLAADGQKLVFQPPEFIADRIPGVVGTFPHYDVAINPNKLEDLENIAVLPLTANSLIWDPYLQEYEIHEARNLYIIHGFGQSGNQAKEDDPRLHLIPLHISFRIFREMKSHRAKDGKRLERNLVKLNCSESDKMILKANPEVNGEITITSYLFLCQNIYKFQKRIYLDLAEYVRRSEDEAEAEQEIQERYVDIELEQTGLDALTGVTPRTRKMKKDAFVNKNQPIPMIFKDDESEGKGNLIDENLSAGGGVEKGKHHGGGISLKLKIGEGRSDTDGQQEIAKKSKKDAGGWQESTPSTAKVTFEREKRQDMMNLFFTW